ncbi:hypothetical protein LCGC14_2210340 [marine sediment metagenome]|uniref:Uncharacterized protein n=1 Tax=marine sediment metagenome TaxID=412755 RepID=A0A0F9FRF1_9ZZZZ
MYILLQPDEDGNVINLLDETALRILLNNPRDEFGVHKFLSEKTFKQNSDPMYWNEGDAVLLKVEKVIIPKPVATKYIIE